MNDRSNASPRIDYWIRASTTGGHLRFKLRLLAKLWLRKVVIFLNHGAKRLFDIIFSSFALLLVSPIFVLTALFIKLEDGGPIFFNQTRVGYRGKLFSMWKIRSMVIDADEVKCRLREQNEMNGNVRFKMENDPRMTRVGKTIRKYSVDELPQFWNVLKGDMSMVGPRPALPKEVKQYSVEARQRLLVKPGITCLWQVGGRSQIDFAGQIRLDLAYIHSSNIWIDLKVLILTIPVVVSGKGAY